MHAIIQGMNGWPESASRKRTFSREFKLEAVRLCAIAA